MSGSGREIELIAALVKSQSTLALATVDEHGLPQLAPLFYLAEDNLSLYWFSSSSSAHGRNLEKNPTAAVSIYRPTENWKEICGVQMRGSAAAVTAREQRKAITRLYVERFRLGTIFRVAISQSVLYAFRPHWIRYLDNSRRFGYKFEITLAPGAPGEG